MDRPVFGSDFFVIHRQELRDLFVEMHLERKGAVTDRFCLWDWIVVETLC